MKTKIEVLNIGLGNTGIQYNTPEELETDKGRGTVLPTGEVVRGIGTHFKSLEDKQRYDQLIKQSNKIRTAVAEHFIRAPGNFPSTFVVNALGDMRKFVNDLVAAEQISPDVHVSIEGFEIEGELSSQGIATWNEDIKKQLVRVQLGRKKGQVDREALDALEMIADCPALSKETAGSLRKLVGEFRAGGIKKDDFQRSIELLDVKVDAEAAGLGPKRALPEGMGIAK